jgi:UDP-GlcNAc:undecaprenyl-phosphate/decaprenyl-phosphate GlcNAc-1-phosphate transferase
VREYVLTLLVTAAVTYLLTPLVRRGAIRAKAMPAVRDRDVHVEPTPRWGGLAMYFGLAAGLLVASQMTPLNSVFTGSGTLSTEQGLLLAGGLIVVIGLVDDRWGMSPISKLAGQVAAGAILVASGCELNWLPIPGGATFSPTSNQAMVLTILVVVVTINAVNFIDGLDGLAAGIVAISAGSFFVYYYWLTHVLRLSAEAQPTLVSAVLAGMCLGFLPHNFFPAKIFMGDTGSMLLGLLLAYTPISSISSLDPLTLTSNEAYRFGTVNRFPEVLPLLLPAAILVIPYADMLMAVFRRTRAGMSPFAPDRKHLHHRLLYDIGHSHRSSVLIMYLWATLFSSVVVWLSVEKRPSWVFAVTTVCAMTALLLMSMPRLRWWGRAARRQAALGAQAVSSTARQLVPVGAPVPEDTATATATATDVWTRPANRPAGSPPVAGRHAGGPSLGSAARGSAARGSAASEPSADLPGLDRAERASIEEPESGAAGEPGDEHDGADQDSPAGQQRSIVGTIPPAAPDPGPPPFGAAGPPPRTGARGGATGRSRSGDWDGDLWPSADDDGPADDGGTPDGRLP